jgi:hypothetical protein
MHTHASNANTAKHAYITPFWKVDAISYLTMILKPSGADMPNGAGPTVFENAVATMHAARISKMFFMAQVYHSSRA